MPESKKSATEQKSDSQNLSNLDVLENYDHTDTYMLHIKHLELIVIHNFRKALKAKNIRTLSKKRGKIQKPSDIRLVILLWLRTMCEAHKLLVMMKLLVLVHRRFSHCTN